jgi:hypothetical protein
MAVNVTILKNLQDVGGGIAVHPEIDIQVTNDPGVEGIVRIKAVYDPILRRFVAESVELVRSGEGKEVTGTSIRTIRVQEYVHQALDMVGVYFRRPSGAWVMLNDAADEIPTAKEQGPVPETLAWVARVYRLAEIMNARPAKTVAEEFAIPYPTATNWIARARAAGLME